MKKMYERIKAVALKESYHILRDPFTLAMGLIMPVVLVLIFGFAIDLDVKNIPIAIVDNDNSIESRQIIDVIKNTNRFEIKNTIINMQHDSRSIEEMIRSEGVRGVIIINDNQSKKNLRNEKNNLIQFVVDGSDNAIVGPLASYITGIALQLELKVYANNNNTNIINFSNASAIKIETRYLYNGELKSEYFIVPGLACVVLAIVSILLTALTISREWENGSMELLLSTPISPREIIIGKILPYSLIGMFAVMLVYLMSRIVFDIPFRGNHLVFIFSCLIFLTAYLAQGILISTVAKMQALAMQMAMVSGLLPTILLSGFIYPISSMPKPFQIITMILPARWFLEIIRTLFLKESGVREIAVPLFVLLIINFVLITAASKKLKRSLE